MGAVPRWEGDWRRHLKELAFALGLKDHVVPLSADGKGLGAESHQAGFGCRVLQIGLSSEVEESWDAGLGREVWAILLRDSNSKQGVWNLIAKVSLKEPGRGATV